MKPILALAAVLLVAGFAGAADFGYPVDGDPWYAINARFDSTATLGRGLWTIARVTVDGRRARDFAVFQNGVETPAPDVDGSKPFDLKIRWSWERGRRYEVKAEMENTQAKRREILIHRAQAPGGKGYWNPAWKNYLSLIVSEDDGIDRPGVPVQATFGVLSSYLRSPDELRLVRVERRGQDVTYSEIPFQVSDVRKWDDPALTSQTDKDPKTGKAVARYHPTTSFGIGFLARLKPRQKATYILFYNNPGARKPVFKTDLKVSGNGLGKTVENAFYKAILHPKSGTLYEIVEKSSGLKLEHKLETNGSVHWNPDVYSPPHAWYHVSDWERPAWNEDLGPVFYTLRREAPLPLPKGIQISVTYTFFAGEPYILMESAMEIRQDIPVQSLRNAEVVFNKAVFEKAAWREVDGSLHTLDFAASRLHPRHAAELRPDTPWVAFYGEKKRVGFATLFLDLLLPNLHGGSASAHQPYIYIQNGPWFYVSRGFVYSFGSNNQTRMLPVKAGSVYYDRNAWLPFAYSKETGFAARLDALRAMLKRPLGLKEDMETYAESPEGWVAPVLTEPFEEGVRGTIPTPKKK